jgi:hypothetical protein
MESFTYLAIIVFKQWGTDADVKIRVSKARAAFIQIKDIWTCRYVSTNTTIRLFNSNVKSIPHVLYGAATWGTTVNIYHKENPDIHQQLSENGPLNTLA